MTVLLQATCTCTWFCTLGLFILHADPQWVPALAHGADNPHCLLLILGHQTPNLVRERNIPRSKHTVTFRMGTLGGSTLDYSYLLRLLCLKAQVFNCMNQKSLCPVPSENHSNFQFKAL